MSDLAKPSRGGHLPQYPDLVQLGVGAGKAWFGILGPLTAEVPGGRRLDLGGRKQRELLGLLLINVNKCLTAERIADALWNGGPPASAKVTLRSHVSHLRQRLAAVDAHDALVTGHEGYGLHLDADQLDATRFEQLVESGREASRRGEMARASKLFADALRLWRGAVLDDIGPPEFAHEEAARLDELRLTALDHRIDADLALGNHGALIAELLRLVAAQPFRERLHCHLMLALYRTGRQADALAVSASIRRRLADELGVDPGPALRDLETAILRHDPTLTLPPPHAVTSPSLPTGAFTKYHPPTSVRSLVLRRRLIDTLREGSSRRLTVIHGPAGFGKTTLAAQWRGALTDEGVEVAWLTIDDDDNNVVWFLAHLIEAVRVVRPGLGEGQREALEARGEGAQRHVLNSLINEIDSGASRFVVVIDDWHRVDDRTTIQALTYLLDNAGRRLQVVVTSRTRAGLPTGRLRMRDELLEIDSGALRFDTPESRSLLVDIAGLTLADHDVADLERTTDGWVAALQLASVSLRDCGDPAAMISRMSGRHHAIGEYLAENVLDRLDSTMLDFLMATSVTDRISGGLACALAGVHNGQALLEEVEERDLFLRRLDDEREWFRYHDLFAQFLRRRLERDQPQRITEIHAIASCWFAENDLLREAVHHALAAGDDARAVSLVQTLSVELVQHSQMSTVLTLVSKLPADGVVRSPRLQLAIAWASVMLQRPADARIAMDAFESAIKTSAIDPSELRAMKIEADVIRAVVACRADQTSGVAELVAECLSSPNEVTPLVVAAAADVACLLDIYRFDFEAARRRQEWALTYHLRSAGPFTLVYGHCMVGMAAMEELEVAEAERCFREALRVAAESGDTHSYPSRLASGLLGELLYERGDVDEADRLLDESYLLGADGGVVELMIASYAVGARVKAVRKDHAGALERLDAGARVAAKFRLPRLQAHIDNERMRLGLAGSEIARRDQDALPEGGLGEITAQLRDETEIRRLFCDQPDLACRRAHAWVGRLAQQRRPRAMLQAKRLLAAALIAADRTDEANRTLSEIAEVCAQRGMARYLLDGGPSVVSLSAGDLTTT